MTVWRKSSRSTANGSDVACVEVSFGESDENTVAVRDSKNPEGPRLAVSDLSWQTFLRSVR
ncbi:DUF397 domain-containing protein [Pseudonocardiaceae bacterium YIM PH 21723]|nr:DUF397 domain-containing protein [Pseudonocardiaceae bacterium YIM PH 21723]